MNGEAAVLLRHIGVRGVFDDEFKKSSIQLFEQVKRGEVVCLYSEIVDKELEGAPKRVTDHFNSIPAACVERLAINSGTKLLANLYISENVVGASSFEDCIHIALATISKADLLVSWNFKHIVNIDRIKGYNSVNLKSGYRELKITSPKQLIADEEEIYKKKKGL